MKRPNFNSTSDYTNSKIYLFNENSLRLKANIKTNNMDHFCSDFKKLHENCF